MLLQNHTHTSKRQTEKWLRFKFTPMSIGLLLAACGSCANAAGQCVANPPIVGDDGLPAEIAALNPTLIFSDNFDSQPDFATEASVEYCINNAGNGCDRLPPNWSDYKAGERFHPIELNNSSLESSLQINGDQPRGSSGKSLMIWDESYGNTGQWGSDAMLGKYLPEGYKDLYVEYWIKFQPGYRWHDVEGGHGINYAKILRIGHRDEGQTPFSFSATGYNAPLMFIDTIVRSVTKNNAPQYVQAGVQAQLRCDPQESNYKCGTYTTAQSMNGYINDGNTSFVESYGDGNWHKISARMRLNSSPGARDGIAMTFFDNEMVAYADDVPFLGSNSPAGTKLNQVSLGGNMHNYPEPESNQFEQWYAIDDVRIYTIN